MPVEDRQQPPHLLVEHGLVGRSPAHTAIGKRRTGAPDPRASRDPCRHEPTRSTWRRTNRSGRSPRTPLVAQDAGQLGVDILAAPVRLRQVVAGFDQAGATRRPPARPSRTARDRFRSVRSSTTELHRHPLRLRLISDGRRSCFRRRRDTAATALLAGATARASPTRQDLPVARVPLPAIGDVHPSVCEHLFDKRDGESPGRAESDRSLEEIDVPGLSPSAEPRERTGCCCPRPGVAHNAVRSIDATRIFKDR